MHLFIAVEDHVNEVDIHNFIDGFEQFLFDSLQHAVQIGDVDRVFSHADGRVKVFELLRQLLQLLFLGLLFVQSAVEHFDFQGRGLGDVILHHHLVLVLEHLQRAGLVLDHFDLGVLRALARVLGPRQRHQLVQLRDRDLLDQHNLLAVLVQHVPAVVRVFGALHFQVERLVAFTLHQHVR